MDETNELLVQVLDSYGAIQGAQVDALTVVRSGASDANVRLTFTDSDSIVAFQVTVPESSA